MKNSRVVLAVEESLASTVIDEWARRLEARRRRRRRFETLVLKRWGSVACSVGSGCPLPRRISTI